jgi:hypothetical protein
VDCLLTQAVDDDTMVDPTDRLVSLWFCEGMTPSTVWNDAASSLFAILPAILPYDMYVMERLFICSYIPKFAIGLYIC